MSNNTKKRITMVKHRVGCTKAPTRNLPDGDFTYGKKNSYNDEGAGDGSSKFYLIISINTIIYINYDSYIELGNCRPFGIQGLSTQSRPFQYTGYQARVSKSYICYIISR